MLQRRVSRVNGWQRCEVPQVKGSRGCWKAVLADFDASEDECWRRSFDSRKRAQNVARALKVAADNMTERGEIKPVRISRCGKDVYIISGGFSSVRA